MYVCIYIYIYIYIWVYVCVFIMRRVASRLCAHELMACCMCICMRGDIHKNAGIRADMQLSHVCACIPNYACTKTDSQGNQILPIPCFHINRKGALCSHNCFYYTSKPECAIPDDNSFYVHGFSPVFCVEYLLDFVRFKTMYTKQEFTPVFYIYMNNSMHRILYRMFLILRRMFFILHKMFLTMHVLLNFEIKSEMHKPAYDSCLS
jgi:hypothetical protein